MNKYKQAIVLRKDLKMSCGKAIAQGCHASQEAIHEACRIWQEGNNIGRCSEVVRQWEENGYHKVVLAVIIEEELVKIYEDAFQANLPCVLIEDFGLTQLEPGTKTAVGIGPARVGDIDKIVGHLKLY